MTRGIRSVRTVASDPLRTQPETVYAVSRAVSTIAGVLVVVTVVGTLFRSFMNMAKQVGSHTLRLNG